MATITGNDIKTMTLDQMPASDWADAAHDGMWVRHLGRAIDFIHTVRPDAFVTAQGDHRPSKKPAALADVLVLDDYWSYALSELLGFFLLSRDSTDKGDKTRAQAHLKNALNFMQGIS